MSALDVALMGALAHGRWWLPPRRAERAAARAALERVGLADEADTRFGELSGGQRQRALLARALVQDAPVLLLDEPLAGVDPASAQQIDARVRASCAPRAARCSCRATTSRARAASTWCSASTAARSPSARPREALDRATIEATYGRELIVLDEPGGAAVTIQHHEHGHGEP